MNTKKLVKWIELLIFSILLAFLIPLIFEWVQTGSLEISSNEIQNALFLGIMVPVIMLLSKNIKNDYFFVFIALVLISVILFFTRLAIHV
ncbi:MAG TPA: hypothetical protein VKA10_03220 [Prolixibacteraceae bacterium]|nr:hypothetical protein [Prolixibacteraceae bacterium]